MTEKTTIVFHGFLNLTAKEKLNLVEQINNYFDSNERESVRAENDDDFQKIALKTTENKCPCCER